MPPLPQRESQLLKEVSQLREAVSRMKQDDALFAEERQRWQAEAGTLKTALAAVAGLAVAAPLAVYFLLQGPSIF